MTDGSGDDAARFYAEESAKVLKCYFHAATLTGRNLDDLLAWVANPTGTTEPEEILSQHPHAAKFWNAPQQGPEPRAAVGTPSMARQLGEHPTPVDGRRPQHG
jgi:type IV secretion system protein VirD4